MTWQTDLRKSNISLHLICTGAGAGLQNLLWQIPGCSDFLSGAAFPYAPSETSRLLGFTPEKFCSEETAIDLASQAYMRAYTFGGKKPVGLGLTASVASEKEHRGDHRVHICVVTDDKVLGQSFVLPKGKGAAVREGDGIISDQHALMLLTEAVLGVRDWGGTPTLDWTSEARARFFAHPYFTTEGTRLTAPPKKIVLMPGSYNPPHQGHYNVAQEVAKMSGLPVIYSVTADSVHKPKLTVQGLLKRARGLRGHNRLFTQGDALFIDKARMFPETPIAMGADALQQMLDPKWGTDVRQMLIEFAQLGTRFYVCQRPTPGKRSLTLDEVFVASGQDEALIGELFYEIHGNWEYSSTEERAKAGL